MNAPLNPALNTLSPTLERQARRNVALRWGWLVHATVFALVNVALWLAGHRSGWLGLPTGGWFIGLLVHGAVVWLRPASEGIRTRMLEAERQRLQGR